MSEEGLHEFQLNGKQLVFLFMASTVAAVVIFLCGVLVGRGAPGRVVASAVESSEQPPEDPTAAVRPAPETADAPENAAGADLTYDGRLESPNPPSEVVSSPPATAAAAPFTSSESARGGEAPKPVSAAPAAKPQPTAGPVASPRVVPTPPASTPRPAAAPAVAAERPRTEPAAAASAPAGAALAEPSGDGFVVQVAAVRDHAEAVIIAQRLGVKGYPAFVTTAGPNMFRVRVGKYQDRAAANAVAGRLEREEQVKPWITR